MNAVNLTGISKTYTIGPLARRKVEALVGINLLVEHGQIFGLLGPNGAGKTTLVKILLGVVHPTQGNGTVLDRPIGLPSMLELCGYLPENHRYPLFLTARDTLLFFGRLSGIAEKSLRNNIDPLLELVGLKEWKRVRIKRFSKGMLQRLGLAQALINDPEILFLDEPTDGVDPIGRKEIRDILIDLKKQGKTIFLNSHMLSEVESISDRVAILNKGEIVRTGTVEEITRVGKEFLVHFDSSTSEEIVEKALRNLPSARRENSSFIIPAGDLNELNRSVDILRSHHILIESVIPVRASLEDSFIQLIKSETPK
jgi:ABC-2 type transport system ATP-binding protein